MVSIEEGGRKEVSEYTLDNMEGGGREGGFRERKDKYGEEGREMREEE